MGAREVVGEAREAMTVRRVYGEPYERGAAFVPAAKVRGSGGAATPRATRAAASAGLPNGDALRRR
ncbi:MAG: hypothetical protein ACRDF0_07615 [Candidatus Limnocylindria bacterium]